LNDVMVLTVVALSFAGIVMLGYSLWWYTRSQRDAEQLRLRRRLGIEVQVEVEEQASAAELLRGQADAATEWLGDTGIEYERMLKSANLDVSVSVFLAAIAGTLVLCTVLALSLMGPPGIIAGMTFGYAPIAYVKYLGKARMTALTGQLPDGLEMMARAMQAGVGLADVFKLVGEQAAPPLADEFALVYEEVRFGREWRDALNNLTARNPAIFDLRLLSSSILLQREAGGNLIELFMKLSKTVRNRQVFDARVRAMTAESRLSALILIAMPLMLFTGLVFFNPGYLDPLFYDETGRFVGYYAVTSYGIGIITIQRASDIKV
jgi:tight adherence protein B